VTASGDGVTASDDGVTAPGFRPVRALA
jgi:hypothetical protein